MVEFLQYATSGFWVFCGTVILIGATSVGTALVIEAIALWFKR